MLNMLLSPNGRLSSGEFIKAALILIGLGILLSLPEMMGMSKALTGILGIISFLLIIPWIFIWIKRYRDGGKSGWMCLLPILTYTVLIIILMGVMMGDMFGYIFSVSAEGGTPDEAEMEALMKAKMVPMTIGSIVISLLVVFGFNAMIKTDHSA